LIDLRYHIVSIMGVFLALGLGILLGSSVVSDAVDAQLRADLETARDERDAARSERKEFEDAATALRRNLNEAAPWVTDSLLEGVRFILVADGSGDELRAHVREALQAGGAEAAGRLQFEERLHLTGPEDRQELIDAVTAIVPACGDDVTEDCFDTEGELVDQALTLLGERFTEPVGRVLLGRLIDSGFLSAPERPDGEWPPSDAIVAFLASVRSDGSDAFPGTRAFVRAVSGTGIATLVATTTLENESLVRDLRDESGLPETLATFGSATAELDPGRLGVFTAMVAATEGRGDHFGAPSTRDPFVAPAPGLE
jgi:hypothetical protein